MRLLSASLLLFIATTVASADPPKIVSTNPEIGATDVDPSTTKLTVTFDQRMDKGFSWTGGGDQFPTTTQGQQPTWSKNRRTCTLPVSLEPAKQYRLGINSKNHRNFRGTNGEVVTPTVFTFTTAAADPSATETNDNVLLEDSFESGEKAPTGWNSQAASGVRLTWDTRLAHTGERSLKLSKTANSYFPISSWKRRIEHTQTDAEAIQLEAFVKASKAQKTVLDVLFLDADSQWVSHKWTSYIGADESNPNGVTCDWKKFSGTVAVPPGTKFIELSAQIYGPGTIWLDDLKATYAPASSIDVE